MGPVFPWRPAAGFLLDPLWRGRDNTLMMGRVQTGLAVSRRFAGPAAAGTGAKTQWVRFGLLWLGTFARVVTATSPLQAAEADRPNMILILMDDLGFNDLGVQTYPSPSNYYPDAGPAPQVNLGTPDPDIPEPNRARLLTPALDSLAASGLRMTAFHSSHKCSPSRASLLTGRYDRRVGINMVFNPTINGGLSTREVTLPELLRERGYATGMIGKWHLGFYASAANPFQMMPLRHGFGTFFGVPHSNDMADFWLVENEIVLDSDFSSASEQAQLTWLYTEKALDFIQRCSASPDPFFLYLAHTMPHRPVYPSDHVFTNADGTRWPKFQGASGISHYYDIVMEVDHGIGRILQKLEDLGIRDRTIVMFTSDNGPWLRLASIDLASQSVGCAYPLRDSKLTTWEGGCRVPFLASWPGRIPAGAVSGETAGLVDLLPTLVRLGGGAPPQDRTIDGIDLWPLWSSQPGWTSPRASYALFEGSGALGAILKGDWKLRDGKLYNLANDIQESVDEATNDPAVASDLDAEGAALLGSIAADNQPWGTFTAFEVVLTADELAVPEGGAADFGVRLSADPGTNVAVAVTRWSGDADLGVSGGGVLSFDASNWSVTQIVTLAAAPDADDEAGGATFRVTSPQIDAVREVFVREADTQAPPQVDASLIWPSAERAVLRGCGTKLAMEGRALLGGATNPAETAYRWLKVSGPGDVGFARPDARESGASFATGGVYTIRFRADHPASGGYGSADVRAYVGVVPGITGEFRYAPPLAYDATLDEDGDATWENLISPGVRDWALAARVSRTTSDPAPSLPLIGAAWQFAGGGLPAGGVSYHMDNASTGDASIEVWFKPEVFPVPAHQVLWETGGDIGASLTLNSNGLFFAVDDGGSNAVMGDVAQATLAPDAAQDGFVHAVGAIDLGARQIRLYVDGALADERDVPLVADWCGTSYSGLGTIADTAGAETANMGNLGGNDLLPAPVSPFAGLIASVRFYNRALTTEQVGELRAVPACNLAPEVVAGTDRDVAYTEPVILGGWADDDGAPDGAALTARWSQETGPAGAAFDDASATNTSCAFDLPGEYWLRLEADDTEVKVCDQVTIRVAPLTYAEWAGGIGFPPGEEGPRANPDGDGLPNIWEWALALDPLSPNSLAVAGAPRVTVTDGRARFTFDFDVPRNRRPSLLLEGSDDLLIWSPIPDATPEVSPLDAVTERWRYALERDPAAQPRYFVRPAVSE